MDTATITVVTAAILLLVAAALFWRLTRGRRQAAEMQRAVSDFDAQRPQMERSFLAAAAASGKPRGLLWKECPLNGSVVYARDSATQDLYALAGVTISFEAVAGGDMEDVEAVGNLRAATAVFIWRNDTWTTDGRAVFNLEPQEVVGHYGESLEEVVLDGGYGRDP